MNSKFHIISFSGISALLILMGMVCQARVGGAEEPNSRPVPGAVCEKLQALFQKYYPKATFRNLGVNGIHFEYEVTTFEFPYTGPPGRKHMATTERGPKKGGILCSVYLEKGKYSGQIALMPRLRKRAYETYSILPGGNSQYDLLIDRKVYKTLLMAPYSAKRDAHLWVSVSYPPDASEEFLKEFRALMDEFEDEAIK